jgi:predicted double-glycine peptidase
MKILTLATLLLSLNVLAQDQTDLTDLYKERVRYNVSRVDERLEDIKAYSREENFRADVVCASLLQVVMLAQSTRNSLKPAGVNSTEALVGTYELNVSALDASLAVGCGQRWSDIKAEQVSQTALSRTIMQMKWANETIKANALKD